MIRRSNPACNPSHPVSGTSVGVGGRVGDGALVGGALVGDGAVVGVAVDVGMRLGVAVAAWVEVAAGVLVEPATDGMRLAVSVGTTGLTLVDEPQALSKIASKRVKQ